VNDQVADAFDLLQDEIALVLGTLGAEVADAGTSRDFALAAQLAAQAQTIEAVLDDVRALEARWDSVSFAPVHADESDETAARGGVASGRRNLGRAARGTKTPEGAFYRPILEILVSRGGSATVGAVLDQIERSMGDMFTEVDLQPLPSSDGRQVRWRNTAQWARNTLVTEGLMERPRRRGQWEVAQAGRDWLAIGAESL